MIQKYSTVAGVINALGERAQKGRCMQCKRLDVNVYPLMALSMCAPCIVIATSGRRG